MSTAVLPETAVHAEMSPRTRARIAGALFLLTIVTGIVAQVVIGGRIIVSGDAAATARNIGTQESLFRLGFTIYLIEMSAQIAMTALFYDLLKPVNRPVAALSAAFSYIGCGIKTLSRLFYFAPLFVLGSAGYLTVFSAPQREALAMLFLKFNDQAAGIALVFFGFHTVLKGYLILKSTFLPRALGVLTMIGGAGWLAFLSPSLGSQFFPVIAGFGILSALASIVWLLVFGVNDDRWLEQAQRSRSSIWR